MFSSNFAAGGSAGAWLTITVSGTQLPVKIQGMKFSG